MQLASSCDFEKDLKRFKSLSQCNITFFVSQEAPVDIFYPGKIAVSFLNF